MRISLSPWILAAVCAMSLEISGCAAKTHSADARLQAIYTEEWRWRDEQFADNEDAQKPIRDHLPKVDPATQAMRLRMWQEVLHKLDAIPRAELSAAEQLNYDVYRPQIEALIASQQFRDYEMPANSDSTFWTDLGYTARRPYRTIQRLPQLDCADEGHSALLSRADGGHAARTAARLHAAADHPRRARCLDHRRHRSEPEASLFYTPFKDMPGVPQDVQSALRAEAIGTIRETVQPAYRELLTFMRTEYIPGARTSLAAYDLPDGKNYYRAKIREYTTLDRDPEVIHAFGESEVARLRRQMLEAMRDSRIQG